MLFGFRKEWYNICCEVVSYWSNYQFPSDCQSSRRWLLCCLLFPIVDMSFSWQCEYNNFRSLAFDQTFCSKEFCSLSCDVFYSPIGHVRRHKHPTEVSNFFFLLLFIVLCSVSLSRFQLIH
jgi:hypothetical protein